MYVSLSGQYTSATWPCGRRGGPSRAGRRAGAQRGPPAPCLPPRPGGSRRRLQPRFPARGSREGSHQTPISTTVTASTCAARAAAHGRHVSSRVSGGAGRQAAAAAAGQPGQARRRWAAAAATAAPAVGGPQQSGQPDAPQRGSSAPARHRGSLFVQATAASVPRSRPHGGPPHGRSARPSSAAPTHPPTSSRYFSYMSAPGDQPCRSSGRNSGDPSRSR